MARLTSLNRAISLAILASLAFPFSATYLWLHVQKLLVKQDVKARLLGSIDRSELETLVFSLAQAEVQLRWEGDGEFECDGKMYDVIERQISGDSVRYLCWRDDEETALNQRLRRLLAEATSGSPEQKAREKRYYQWLKSLALNPNVQPFARERVSAFRFPALDFRCRAAFLLPESPPPESSRS